MTAEEWIKAKHTIDATGIRLQDPDSPTHTNHRTASGAARRLNWLHNRGKYDVDMFVGGIHILVPSHDQLGPLSYSDWSVLELIADALRRGRL
jgi:hypothetical protein